MSGQPGTGSPLEGSSKGSALISSGTGTSDGGSHRQSGLVLAIVAPGQGSQSPGFLRPWLDQTDFVTCLRAYGEVVGLDLVALGSDGDALATRDIIIFEVL